jgi:hypothetical protein
MKTSTKMAAGWLLTLGFMFLTISVSEIIRQTNQSKEKPSPEDYVFSNPHVYDNDTIIGGIVFGIPSTLLGGWLALDLYRQSKRDQQALQQQKNQLLQSNFYQMLQEHHGKITVLGFAMQSDLSAADARNFLDKKAKEFNANFQVNEEGAVSYHFDV